MLVGLPKEIKNHEYRVGLTPTSVRELIANGHSVLVQSTAGEGIGEADAAYTEAGAQIASTAEQVFKEAEMIVKVKEPQPNECEMLQSGQVLFTYLHLAPDRRQTELLLESDAVAIAYETVTDRNGALPLLAPMSEVAGRPCRCSWCRSSQCIGHWWWRGRHQCNPNGCGYAGKRHCIGPINRTTA